MKRVPHGAWRREKGDGSRCGVPRSTFGIVMLWLVVWLGATAAAPSCAGDALAPSTGSGQPFDRLRAGTPNLGIEGRASLTLPGPDYRPRPLDDRTELILRVEKIVPLTNGQHRYDFYYMGLEPGAYRLIVWWTFSFDPTARGRRSWANIPFRCGHCCRRSMTAG